ncbi:MAG: ATP-binding cassette domain-containing protein [Gemmatimonadaceae bacterium]
MRALLPRAGLAEPSLSGRGLTKAFRSGLARAPRRHVAIDSVNIDVRPGELLGIVGGAGAGKTTLLQCLCGLLKLDKGRVELFGDALDPGFCPLQVAYVPAVPVYYPFLTPRDVLQFRAARTPGPPADSRASSRILRSLELDGLDRCRISSLPGDVIRRVAVAEALAGRPEVVLVDSGAEDLFRPFGPAVLSALAGRAESGMAVVLATRDASAIAFTATRIFLLDEGRTARTFALESFGEPIIATGSPFASRVVAERVH